MGTFFIWEIRSGPRTARMLENKQRNIRRKNKKKIEESQFERRGKKRKGGEKMSPEIGPGEYFGSSSTENKPLPIRVAHKGIGSTVSHFIGFGFYVVYILYSISYIDTKGNISYCTSVNYSSPNG